MSTRRQPVPPESVRDAAALMLAIVTSDYDGVDAILDNCGTEQTLIAAATLGLMMTQQAANIDDEALTVMLRTVASQIAYSTGKEADS